MENVHNHLHTHVTAPKKSKKKKPAPSKLVECALCGSMIFTRGLHSHMRLAHHVVSETVTKVIDSPTIVKTSHDLSQLDSKHMQTTGANLSHDYSQPASRDLSQPASHDYKPTVKIVEEITTYKKVELVPGSRGGKIKSHFGHFMDQMDAHVSAGRNYMAIDQDHPSVKIN